MIKKPSPSNYKVSLQGNRKINQDRCEIFEHKGITVLVLADGLGGHPKGEIAAQLLVNTCFQTLQGSSTDNFDTETFVNRVFRDTHQAILDYGKQQEPAIQPRTTATLVIIHNGMMTWSHLGDSRIYLFRHQRAHLRTLDHTRAEQMQLEQDFDPSSEKLPNRHGVSRCLGGKRGIDLIEITPPIPLQDNDIILLCSDGVWGQLSNACLEQYILEKQQSLASRLTNLVEKAVAEKYPNSDNATALALCWHPDTSASLPEQPESIDTVDAAVRHLQDLVKQHTNQEDNA